MLAKYLRLLAFLKIGCNFIPGSLSQETTATFSGIAWRAHKNMLSPFLHFEDGWILSTHGDVQLFLPCETWRTWQQQQMLHQGWADFREISMKFQRQNRRATKTASNTELLCQGKCSQNVPKILNTEYLFSFSFYLWILLSSADLPMPQDGTTCIFAITSSGWASGVGCSQETWTQSHNDSAIGLNT